MMNCELGENLCMVLPVQSCCDSLVTWALISGETFVFKRQYLIWDRIIQLVKMFTGTWSTVRGISVTQTAVICGVFETRLIVEGADRIPVRINELLAISKALEVNCAAHGARKNLILGIYASDVHHLSSERIAEDLVL